MTDLRLLLVWMMLGGAAACCGCSSLPSTRSAAELAATPAESSDPWIQQAGTEARGERVREKSEEPPWFRNIIMSEKARDIESNLGID